MHQEIIFSGFGGQGALFAGQLLAYAALDSGLQVTWIPSYGPEMRGGTAHCTVIVADEPIGSPLVHRPAAVVALNLPSFEKYEPRVKPGGLMVYNESLFRRRPQGRTSAMSRCRRTISPKRWAMCARRTWCCSAPIWPRQATWRWRPWRPRWITICLSASAGSWRSNKEALRRGAACTGN